MTTKQMYNEIKKFETLTQEQTLSLFNGYNNGDTKAKDKLIQHNLKLVIHFAKRYKVKSDFIELDDLISEGILGLIKAIEKFDTAQSSKFPYYASFWINKYITDFIVTQSDVIKSPYTKKLSNDKIQIEVAKIFQDLQCEIQPEHIHDLNQFTESEINHFFNHKGTISIEDFNVIPNEEEVEDNSEILKKQIKHNLKNLNTRERFIIKSYFGIDTKKMNLQQIGEVLGVTKMRVSQIKSNCLLKLKTCFKK